MTSIDEVRTFYDNYLDKLTTPNERHRWITNSFKNHIPHTASVLDIGCGTGITSSALAEGGRWVTAVDISPKLIEYAKAQNSHKNIEYIAGDICDLPLGEFDAIVMADVLEHIRSEDIPRLFRVLRDASHDRTMIYLNIPHHDVLSFLRQNHPDNLQVVDNPITTKAILNLFRQIEFIPTYTHFYWGQYIEYVFITEQRRDSLLRKAFLPQKEA